jgi:hypothetical protein
MDPIIAGRFETKGEADAVALLISQYIDPSDICIFHNNPPGQHDIRAGGGDVSVDPGSDGAGQQSAGAAAVGAVTAGTIGAIGGPVIAMAAAATGAYIGSLAGALDGLGNHDELPVSRPAGILLSVHIANPALESRVIDTLHAEGAADIERAEGQWDDGDWVDFDPVAAPQLVDNVSH